MKFIAFPHEPNGTISMPDKTVNCLRLAYGIRDACKASGLGRTTLYKNISEGRLKAIRIGGRTLIPAAALEAFLAGEGQ